MHMSGPVTFVRAALLGAFLCIVAGLHERAQQPELGQARGLSAADMGKLSPVAPSTASSPANRDNTDDAENQDEPLGDLGSLGIEGWGDDFDQLEDVVFHPRLWLDSQPAAAPPKPVPAEHAQMRIRLEDRRFEKPPRA